jgi:hypothetical protein
LGKERRGIIGTIQTEMKQSEEAQVLKFWGAEVICLYQRHSNLETQEN